MPLKQVAAQVATSVDAVARRTAAVNTLVRRDDGGWDATNTDVVGLVRALAPHLPECRPARWCWAQVRQPAPPCWGWPSSG